MNLKQQIVEQKIEETASRLGLSNDRALLRLAHSLITGQSIHAFDETDIVDGGQDKQVDVLTIETSNDEATVYIIQAKNTNSFSSNILIQMKNGLSWIFSKPRADVATLANTKFKDQITEYRSVQNGLGPSNIQVVVAFVTNGLTLELSDEFNQEAKAIRDTYDNGVFASFDLRIIGADELVDLINALERRTRKIDADLRIRYDANNPSLIKYHSEGLKGIVCSVSAKDIARLVNQDTSGAIFDANIRRYLGKRGAVNLAILDTCTNVTESNLFWFLNNGITIVCDNCDPVTDPDNPHVKIKNMQIVNGCQTATSLAMAEKSGQLAADTRVLVRIYEAANTDLVDRIVLTTNSQNRIGNRDLKSNDPHQIDMERGFEKYGYFYERKVRQYDSIPDIDASKIAVNEIVGQCYLAVVLKNPSDANRRKYKIWDDHYKKIFDGQIIEPHVLAYLIYRHTRSWLVRTNYAESSNELQRKLAKTGTFHIARITSFLWRGGDEWSKDPQSYQANIVSLTENQNPLDKQLEKGLTILEEVIRENKTYSLAEIETALKSSILDNDIDQELHTKHKTKNSR